VLLLPSRQLELSRGLSFLERSQIVVSIGRRKSCSRSTGTNRDAARSGQPAAAAIARRPEPPLTAERHKLTGLPSSRGSWVPGSNKSLMRPGKKNSRCGSPVRTSPIRAASRGPRDASPSARWSDGASLPIRHSDKETKETSCQRTLPSHRVVWSGRGRGCSWQGGRR